VAIGASTMAQSETSSVAAAELFEADDMGCDVDAAEESLLEAKLICRAS